MRKWRVREGGSRVGRYGGKDERGSVRGRERGRLGGREK